MNLIEDRSLHAHADRAVTAVQTVVTAVGSAADLPRALGEVGDIIARSGLDLAMMRVGLVDETTGQIFDCPVLADTTPWDERLVDRSPEAKAFHHQRTERWSVAQLDGAYVLMAVPTSLGFVTAAVAGQEPISADLEEFLRAVSGPLQLIALRARDLRRQDEAARALAQAREELETRVDERTAELSAALLRIQREVDERRLAERERGRAQQLLEHVIRSTPAVLYSCKAERGFPITFVSDNVTALTGFTPQEIIGNPRSWLSQVHPDDVDRLTEETSCLLEKGHLVCEYRLRHKSGETRWIHDEMRLIRARGPRPEIMGSWLDITERVQSEEGRRHAESELESQRALTMRSDRLRSLGEMAAGIAHELNQPLAGVRGKAEHILLGVERGWDLSPETLKDRVKGIVEQADRMVHIIEHVRMFAREAGQPKMTPVHVNDVVNSAVELLGAQFRSHGVHLTTDLAAELPVVTANPFSLEEVLLNLLTNARDAVEAAQEAAMNQGKVQIRTELRAGEARRRVRIEVVDNGGGVPREDLERVFEPFYTTKDPDKGTGLGLSVSKSIVELLGGRIWMDSVSGSETRVSIVLPVADDNTERGPIEQERTT